jgi:hypothetical protein
MTSDCTITIFQIYKKALHTCIFQFFCDSGIKLCYIVMAYALSIVKWWYVQAVVYLFIYQEMREVRK